jgi:hypothetical protein
VIVSVAILYCLDVASLVCPPISGDGPFQHILLDAAPVGLSHARQIVKRIAVAGSRGYGCAARRKLICRCFGSENPWFEGVPERSNAKDPAPLEVKEVSVENRR